ncbi:MULTISPECIES: hypothetical protein [Dysgonomonas]|uniref:hypothetical protein n=1 Tax=Dysgonomonas TaxID=156973 RepID=UPI0009261919|nr:MULTISPECIES: hypothetical protein [Dysgonomonas]MBN9301792.1 hypothetical protein [Dysgonomonas mossii]OJX63034.1 MAG: hypothetical protein BGO84_14105 [Dysgonomonas sp. 37-18]
MKQTNMRQMPKRISFGVLLLLIAIFCTNLTTNAQVTIGSGEPSATGALLQLKDKDNIIDGTANASKGLALPRVNLSQKNQLFPMFLKDSSNPTSGPSDDYAANKTGIDQMHTGLIVYNLVEDDDKELCMGLNQWDGEKWNCFESKLGNAVVEIGNCDSLTFAGIYQNNVSLNASNYMTIPLHVTKAGAYNIITMPDPSNGYYFTASGVFLTTGYYYLSIPGAGTPTNHTVGTAGDLIKITFNGKQLTTCDPLRINVEDSSVKPVYNMSCSATKVRGVYELNKPLDPDANYIEVTLNVTAPYGATYSIETNTVDGIYFKGSGLLSTASQTVKLQGYGTPTSVENKVMTITSNSSSNASTCKATVVVSYPTKSVFAFGYYENTAGYLGQPGSGLRKMMDASVNFGNTENSTVKIVPYSANQTFYPYNVVSGGAAYNTATVKSYLDTKPDIVITGFDLDPLDKATMASNLVDYLKKGGVLIFVCERQAMVKAFFEALYPGYTITADWTTTNVMSLNFVNDDVVNGPFGDIRGLLWGNDSYGASGAQGLPDDDDIVIISKNNSGTPMILKHKRYNLLFISEGGFAANFNGTTGSGAGGSASTYPLAIDASFKPTTRTGWTGGNVENARLMANALAWAIKQAQFNGINTP